MAYKEVDGVGVDGKLCKFKVQIPEKHIGRMIVVTEKRNEMDTEVICPHCGRLVRYGHTCMHNGVNGCQFCIDELARTIEDMRYWNYDNYVKMANNHEWEPYRYREE